jgi:hypothetical protein
MQIFIKTLSGKIINVDIEGRDTIKSVKEKIYEQEGIPVSNQRIIIGGKQPTDDTTMTDCDVQKLTIIHMVLKDNTNTVA